MDTNQENKLSRRTVVGGLTTGLVAAVAPGAFASVGSGSANDSEALTVKRNPVTEFVAPPFKAQHQEWPGLASQMDPRPDHGEISYKGSGRLQGRKALVTGGDSGMGRAAAIAFAREGADVAINYLPAEEPDAKEVIALIRASGRKAVAIPGNIRDESFCNDLVDRAAKELGGLDIVVNNAGRQQQVQKIQDLTTEHFDATLKTNIYAMFWITKASMKYLKPGASIINTASEQAFSPSPNLLDYSTTKGAIVTFTKSLAKQLAKEGIRVNAIAPGPFWTPLQVSGGATEEDQIVFGSTTPIGRPGQPAELASAYVLLASQESSYASGQVIGAQGGRGIT